MSSAAARKECPNCGPRTIHLHAWQDSAERDEIGEPVKRFPVWECCNCGGTHKRILRRTKRQMALARLRGEA